jgi:hypothetical protein
MLVLLLKVGICPSIYPSKLIKSWMKGNVYLGYDHLYVFLYFLLKQIIVGPALYCNKTVVLDYNVGFKLTEANTSDAGSYRCDASWKKNSESAYFYVYVSK